MTINRILVDQTTITKTRTDTVEPMALTDGQVRLKLESFALTANNVTYAMAGFVLNYWRFFPSGIDGQGIVPVWGTARVVESRSEHLALGTRLYGFYPMADELVISPKPGGKGILVDQTPERADLPLVYNSYAILKNAPSSEDHTRALLQPLLATSYLLFDWLIDNACFGAQQIIIGSASSKTGLGLCKFLSEPADRTYSIVGLTSKTNRAFVEGLGACDQVLTYDEVEGLAQVPSVYVDMSGNAAVKARLHNHLRDHVKHSAAVGTSHWDQFTKPEPLPGAKPQFFFAPSQIAKRRAEWGPGVIEAQITQAWKRNAADAGTWMDVRVHTGFDAALPIYAALANGTANPRDGHVIVVPDK